MNRRRFLKTAAWGAFSLPVAFERLAAQHRKKVKITDVKCMIVRGTWDWNLIKIETDSGLYGLGEAYWGPGVKDVVLRQLKPLVLGEDPLNVDKLYTKMLMLSAGAGAQAGVTVTAARAMEAVRDELGPDVDFAVEAHWKYDVRDAIQMAKVIEPVKPMWLEDPVPPGNPEAMAQVARAVNVPIATGENLYTRDGFRRLIE